MLLVPLLTPPLPSVPPSMSGSQWPHNVSVPEGSEVLLECRSRGVPPPRVRWMKDGQ